MHNATLYGAASTQRMLREGRKSDGKPYILQAIGSWSLNDIVVALDELGLGLSRFCVRDDEAEEGARVKLTSEFAIVRRWPGEVRVGVPWLDRRLGG